MRRASPSSSSWGTLIVPLLAFASGNRATLHGRTLAASALALAGAACLTRHCAAAPLTWAGDGAMAIVARVASVLVLRTYRIACKAMFLFLFASASMAASLAAVPTPAAAGFWTGVTPCMQAQCGVRGAVGHLRLRMLVATR